MADEGSGQALELPKAEAGWAFRFEMAATNLLLGYWKHGIAVVVVGLLAVLVWGQYQSWQETQQRGFSNQIVEVTRKLAAPIPLLPDEIGKGAVQRTDLMAPADALAAIGTAATGAGSAEAWLKAAELYRLAGNAERQRAALDAVDGQGRVDVLGYAAASSLANLDLEQGKDAEAIARLESLQTRFDGILGQSAALDLGLALTHLGRKDEARRVYAAFETRWPAAPQLEEVRTRSANLDGAVGAPATPAAPAEAPAAPAEAPAAPAEAPAAPAGE